MTGIRLLPDRSLSADLGLTDEEVQKYMNKYAEPEDISQDDVEADTGYIFYTM